ncbi:CLIP-associating protein 1-A-like [Notothenia coriiceps]|uniref:CLIP-associating protein 1-A-like n=1 Tax=Notothenia coriiceps TaxID=8208 RepID=A0A6I9NJB3_9TELE|nr:PREDICTED: CLIP-associating protein 1-A-like [Notothenia coriiceps]
MHPLSSKTLNVIFSRFDEVQRSGNMVLSPLSDKAFEDDDSGDGGRSSSSSRGGKKSLSMGSFRRTGSSSKSAGRDGSAAGAVDDEDFIQAFEDVPTVQIHSNREVEENMTKIRDVLSDDKKDWELRVAAFV